MLDTRKVEAQKSGVTSYIDITPIIKDSLEDIHEFYSGLSKGLALNKGDLDNTYKLLTDAFKKSNISSIAIRSNKPIYLKQILKNFKDCCTGLYNKINSSTDSIEQTEGYIQTQINRIDDYLRDYKKSVDYFRDSGNYRLPKIGDYRLNISDAVEESLRLVVFRAYQYQMSLRHK